MPPDETPLRLAPLKLAPLRLAPVKTKPVSDEFVKFTLLKFALVKLMPERPVILEKSAPVKLVPEKFADEPTKNPDSSRHPVGSCGEPDVPPELTPVNVDVERFKVPSAVPAKLAVVKFALPSTAPPRFAPSKRTPWQSAPDSVVPVRFVDPLTVAKERLAPLRSALLKLTPLKSTYDRSAPTRDAPDKFRFRMSTPVTSATTAPSTCGLALVPFAPRTTVHAVEPAPAETVMISLSTRT